MLYDTEEQVTTSLMEQGETTTPNLQLTASYYRISQALPYPTNQKKNSAKKKRWVEYYSQPTASRPPLIVLFYIRRMWKQRQGFTWPIFRSLLGQTGGERHKANRWHMSYKQQVHRSLSLVFKFDTWQ